MEIIKQNPHCHWDYFNLSKNPNITWEIIQQERYFFWNKCFVSKNPNITWEIVQANPYFKWDYDLLSYNAMNKAKNKYIQSQIKEYFMEQVTHEMMNLCFHPDNFNKFYELGHSDN